MQYFKYKKQNDTKKAAEALQINNLSEAYRQAYKRDRVLTFFQWLAFIAVLAVGIFLVIVIVSVKQIKDSNALRIALLTTTIPAVIISSCAFPYLISKKKTSINYFQFNRNIRKEACKHLREFYQLNQSFIVTKCYDCFDEKFINHDVCLFFHDNCIRITTDIYNGFIYGYRDLGCYEIALDELKCTYVPFENKQATQIAVSDKKILLGKRAKRFLQTQMT